MMDGVFTLIDIVQDGMRTLNMQPEQILCLGLGSPCESHQARFQLSFLLEMRDTITPVSESGQTARPYPIFISC